MSDGVDAYPCEQEISTGFPHKLVDPYVSAKILAGFDWLGKGTVGSVNVVIDQMIGRKQKPRRGESAHILNPRIAGTVKKKSKTYSD